MNDKTLNLVAERFRMLGDPLRLNLLRTLSGGEMSVGELVQATGASQANVSKHLRLLLNAGMLSRRKQGLHVFYTITDPSVFEICDIVCGSLKKHFASEMSDLEGVFRKR
jgi:ArsR family transcriptional regulator